MSAVVTTDRIRESLESAHDQLRHSGTWWNAAQLGAIARRARDGFVQRGRPPWMRELPTDVPGLPAEALVVIDRIVADAGSVDRAWAHERVAELGEGPYVELVGITAVAVMIHMYAECVDEPVTPLGDPVSDPGSPSQQYPDGVADAGAHVRMLEPFDYANVARALSLVPSANAAFYTLVRPMYSEAGFDELVWRTPLSRPQVELVASRVASMNECFY